MTQSDTPKTLDELLTELRSGTINFDDAAKAVLDVYISNEIRAAEIRGGIKQLHFADEVVSRHHLTSEQLKQIADRIQSLYEEQERGCNV